MPPNTPLSAEAQEPEANNEVNILLISRNLYFLYLDIAFLCGWLSFGDAILNTFMAIILTLAFSNGYFRSIVFPALLYVYSLGDHSRFPAFQFSCPF
jgi:hypothetical protein